MAPWLSSGEVAGKDLNGWPDNVYGPSAIAWNEKHAPTKEMSLDDIENFKKAYKASVERSLAIGFDAIEIHSAHGYLLHSFLSPVSNQRTDKYGGSFENRTRLLREVTEMVRGAIPEDMPLFVRISATDWLEESKEIKESWTVEQTVKIAPLLADLGVDLLDVSSGGNHPAQHPHVGPGYQAPFAKAVKEGLPSDSKMHVGTVGSITSGKQANQLLEEGLDLAVIGRQFQKNPGLVFDWAEELGVEVQMPNQIRWGFGGRGKKAGKPVTLAFKEGKL